MTWRVQIPDDCVYEGYGTLYRGEAEVSPPLLPAGAHDESGVLYRSLDHEEALRQLRVALRIDVPPQLKKCFSQAVPEKLTPPPPKTVGSDRLVCPPDAPLLGPLSSFFLPATERGVDQMNAQCNFLRDWLMCHDNPQERVAARELVRTAQHLARRESVEELLRRAEDLLQQLEAWPVVVSRTRAQTAGQWDDATTLMGLGGFARDVLRTREICAQLAELTRRFFLFAPLVEEAAFRAAALDEIEQWSSESTVSSLRVLRSSVDEWKRKVAEDQQIMSESFHKLQDRITALKKKRRAEMT